MWNPDEWRPLAAIGVVGVYLWTRAGKLTLMERTTHVVISCGIAVVSYQDVAAWSDRITPVFAAIALTAFSVITLDIITGILKDRRDDILNFIFKRFK